MLYLTYNDAPSGIYYSQVTDVCGFITARLDAQVKLLALVSIRGFLHTRKKIKSAYPHSIVLPMFPRAGNWRKNSMLVRLVNFFLREKHVVARGPFAACLCIDLKKKGVFEKVCFDARGAYTAELNEYEVVQDETVKNEIEAIEKKAILGSDMRLAVSQALVNYWKEKFAYSDINHVVIPCTLNSQHNVFSDEEGTTALRKKYGISEDEILACYSGSSAGWQSFAVLDELLLSLLGANNRLKVLFLSPQLPPSMKAAQRFPGRIIQTWLPASQVTGVMQACDYGLLVREKSVTNRVASPVKFAEYLSVGMKVLISEELGDYTDFVRTHECGHVVSPGSHIALKKPSMDEKNKIRQLACNYFSKENYIDEYRMLI